MAPDLRAALLSARRANIERYRGILHLPLSREERRFAEQRLAEEEAAFERLSVRGTPVETE